MTVGDCHDKAKLIGFGWISLIPLLCPAISQPSHVTKSPVMRKPPMPHIYVRVSVHRWPTGCEEASSSLLDYCSHLIHLLQGHHLGRLSILFQHKSTFWKHITQDINSDREIPAPLKSAASFSAPAKKPCDDTGGVCSPNCSQSRFLPYFYS